MSTDELRGKSVRWTYDDGPMAGKTFQHDFASDGTVTWHEPGGSAAQPAATYELARITAGVYAVSYLSDHGWTLTTVVDEGTGRIVSFASNEKQLIVQRGKLI